MTDDSKQSSIDPASDDNDITLQNYQDDLDTKDGKVDQAITDINEDITKEINVDAKEFGRELNKYDSDSLDPDYENERFHLEDVDNEIDDDTK